jgi:hypothetical protein
MTMNESTMTQPGLMRPFNWLLEEWPWHVLLASAVFLALAKSVS